MQKFLCDQMCGHLGRWLRAAGYDTEIIDQPLDDERIYHKAILENRRLLTKDRLFKKIDSNGKVVIYLNGKSIDEWAMQLKDELGINWQYAPFSRCLQCNTLLIKTQDSSTVPEEVRKYTNEFWFCEHCHKIFWRGSHTDRMQEKLKTWC